MPGRFDEFALRSYVQPMENEFMERGYLLPNGCKDLIDAMKQPKHLSKAKQFVHFLKSHKGQALTFKPKIPLPEPLASLPPVIGELVIADQTTVSQLALLLGQKVFEIAADVIQLGFFVTAKDSLSFQIISSVARKYGFIAKPAA